MQPGFQSVLLALGSLPLAYSQLQTIGIISSGATKPTSTTSSLTLSSSSDASSSLTLSSLLTSKLSSSGTSTSPSTPTANDPLVLTTLFTQPSGCSGGMTQVASWSTELWQNIVNPVPTLTLSSCYPSQFYYSAVATTTLPPYTLLVCPLDWETYPITDTYIVCCPSGYGVYLPNYHNSERPGLGAVCTSIIGPDVLMDITVYDSTALATTIYTSAGEIEGTMVFATGFDGTAAPSVATASPVSDSAVSSSAASASTSSASMSSASTKASPITSIVLTSILVTSLSMTSILSTAGAPLTDVSQLLWLNLL